MWTCEVVAGAGLDVDEVAALCRASTLAERRPVGYYPHLGFTRHDSAWVLDALAP